MHCVTDSPYCEEFLTKTLWPAFQDLGTQVMDVTVIPFGNAQVDEDAKTVKCQHGAGKSSCIRPLQCQTLNLR